jgi:hypothetical protein
MIISNIIFGFATPVDKIQLSKLLLLSILFGYFADIIINKYHIFGNNLDPFYKMLPSGANLNRRFLTPGVLRFTRRHY